MDLQVQRDDRRNRYYALIDGQEAHIRFAPVDPLTLDFQHTEVPAGLRGRGIAGALVKAALADVRSRGERIVATCPFVKAYLARHPEDQALAVPV
jgi:predicted GNAT family acetyltransferase